MAIIPILAVLAIAATLFAVWTKSMLGGLHDERLREQRVQVQWLADAGVRRGAARQLADASYVGETWLIPADEIAAAKDASVTIRIEQMEQANEAVRIVVVASYPAGEPRIRISKTATFTPPAEESLP